MTEKEREEARLQLAGLALEALIERETSWASKLTTDLLYEKIAQHSVRLADAVLDELCKEKPEKTRTENEETNS